jgi:hypothetical protein
MNTSEKIFEAAIGKIWEKIDELAAEVKSKGRKEAVSKFTLMSGHDCLTHHLHKIGIYQTADVSCATIQTMSWTVNTLNHEAQQTKDHVSLYWEAREKMI